MSDEKDDDGGDCVVTSITELHRPDCPVTRHFREMAEQVVGKAGEAADAEKAGPAKYNCRAFKQGWEGVFGNKTVGQA